MCLAEVGKEKSMRLSILNLLSTELCKHIFKKAIPESGIIRDFKLYRIEKN